MHVRTGDLAQHMGGTRAFSICSNRFHIVTKMITKSNGIEACVLFGKTRRAILALLFTRTDESFYLRQIERLTGAGLGPIQRELKLLTEAGILERRKVGRHVYFKAKEESPIFNDLKSIIVKTAGIGDVLKSSLSGISDRIECAFIYGSFAGGTARKTSDIDLMVIGDVRLRELVSVLRPAQKKLGREINPSIFTRDEIKERLKSGNAFLKRVLDEDLIFITGGEHELKGMV